ncbi:hypothetical protein HYPBUDRAFT_95687, partial [Hyphopichia burtonii NRRL Y-1933]
ENSELWGAMGNDKKVSLLDSITDTLECAICSEIMHVPFLASCGHSFCYGCLKSWFENKVNCPTCRKDFEYAPVINLQLKQISKNIFQMMLELSKEDTKPRLRHQTSMLEEYEDDFANKRLFGDAFKSTLTLIDRSDGVPRCGNCHWEAHGSSCLHCGSRFRIPRDDAYYDSEDGDAYNEDEEEIVLYGGRHGEDDDEGEPNEYDSQDSFIDERDMAAISNDLNDSENDYLSSGDNNSVSGGTSWRGFDDDDESVQTRDSEPFVDGRLRDLLLQEHEHDMQQAAYDDSDDDRPIQRRGVIHISSDEE